MLGYQHSGFAVDTSVCIEAHDRAALERLLRYCARPPFSMERLPKASSTLVYRCAKQHKEPTGDRCGLKTDELTLTPLALIERIAAQAQNQLASSGFTIFSVVLAATVQIAELRGFWVPHIRAKLGLMRLNFLSVLPT
jgi:Putative transposase